MILTNLRHSTFLQWDVTTSIYARQPERTARLTRPNLHPIALTEDNRNGYIIILSDLSNGYKGNPLIFKVHF
jgi:hypothetical protein